MRRTVLLLVTLVIGGLVPALAAAADPQPLTSTSPPTISGVLRYGSTVVATAGEWSPAPDSVDYQWLRDGSPIAGETDSRHKIIPADVGAQLSVRVLVRADGLADGTATSEDTPLVRYRVDPRHTVQYRIATRGRITTSMKVFRRQVAETLADPRGWRQAGVKFVRVERGGSMVVTLSQASLVPSFGAPCSSMWSCRVGSRVVINQERWKHASPAWNSAHGTLRNYRHMVVNHETGHWLGWHHAQCGGPGQAAPIMQQQSKGLHGCTFNPWPLRWEWNVPRYR